MTAFFAVGHCLLRGVPGLAKTLLIKHPPGQSTSNPTGFSPPDLMPSDVSGTEVSEEDRANREEGIRCPNPSSTGSCSTS
jgi:MoxR-like ATPase